MKPAQSKCFYACAIHFSVEKNSFEKTRNFCVLDSEQFPYSLVGIRDSIAKTRILRKKLSPIEDTPVDRLANHLIRHNLGIPAEAKILSVEAICYRQIPEKG